VRHDTIDAAGVITIRYNSRLHHIGVGRTGTRVLVLIQDLHIRIINAATGELLRQLTLDPTRDYQPTRRPQRPQTEKVPNLTQVRNYSDALRHHMVAGTGFEPATSGL
jgi:hypothetical protein